MKKKKILIVEDETISALGLAEMLGAWNYKACGIASTGEDAVRLAEKERPDVALVDVGLRGKMNGIDAAGELKRKFGASIIFISGYSEDNLQIGLDSYHFLSKPLDFDRLETILSEL